MKKLQIIESLISTGNYETFINEIMKLSIEKKSSYICITNVHMTIESYLDKNFSYVVNNADMATPDGMPIAKAIQFIYKIKQERVAGMDLIKDLFQKCETANKSIFIYGGSQNTLNKLQEKIRKDFPKLNIKFYSPPFRNLSNQEKNNHIKMINEFNPDFVFVVLGCPKQEKWMAEHKNKINSCMIGLGGAIEVYAGIKSRAPKWMQDYSMEWFYRFIQDPKRLWKRYLLTNSLFLILFTIQYIKNTFLKEELNEK